MCLWPISYRPNGYRWQTCFKYSVLHHRPLRQRYQNRARELLDLVFDTRQIHALVNELGAAIGRKQADTTSHRLDAALWNHHPMATSGHRGTFYQNPIRPRHQSATIQFSSAGIEGRIAYFKEYLAKSPRSNSLRGGRAHVGWGFRQLEKDSRDPQIPVTPTVALNTQASVLTAQCTPFTSPTDNAILAAQAWRIAEVYYPGIPGYQQGDPCRFEADALWQRKSKKYGDSIAIPRADLRPGRTYHIRARFA